MSRSNLTLLIMLVSSVLFIAAIPVLYQRELAKSNVKAKNSKYPEYVYRDVKCIRISDAPNVTAISSDSLELEYDATAARDLSVVQAGDTLTIQGAGNLILHLPNVPVVATNSTVLIRGHLRRLDPPSMSFIITDSQIYSLKVASDNRVTQHLQDLSIVSKGKSIVDLAGSFSIQKFYLKNIQRFSCTNDVMFYETDFSFEEGLDVRTLTCREGLNIYNEPN